MSKASSTAGVLAAVAVVALLVGKLFFSAPPASASGVVNAFSWHYPSHSIIQPTFSHSGREVAFVQQFHIPDGEEAEAREGVAESRLAKVATNARLADPVISVLQVGTQRADSVDYGWNPSFSPDDQLLAYAYQREPISGKRVLAETLKGNTIRLHDQRTGQRTTVASPSQGFLLEPVFANASTLLYKLGDATNGAYGGAVGIRQYHLRTRSDSLVQGPQKRFGHFQLFGAFRPTPHGVAYLVWLPQDMGYGWMANEYAVSLKTPSGRLLHAFPKMPFKNLESRVALPSAGSLVYLDDQHELKSEKDYFLRYKGRSLVSKKLFSAQYHEAFLSPDGRYALVCTYENKAYLLEISTYKKTPLELPNTEVFEAVWSESSKQLAVVQSQDEASQDTDVLTVFTVR